ncbi:unnamed protein product, partial [Closterium sp. NIES-65]
HLSCASCKSKRWGYGVEKLHLAEILVLGNVNHTNHPNPSALLGPALRSTGRVCCTSWRRGEACTTGCTPTVSFHS